MSAPASSSVVPRLSAMMFLEIFVWGAWYVSQTGYMNAQGLGGLVSWAYTVGPIAALVSPFFLGMIADRIFSTERVLATLHLLGGLALLAIPPVVSGTPSVEEPGITHPYILLLLAHMLCYMPTLALTTSLSFRHLQSPEKQFPIVRVFGTIGWIAGNIAVSGNLKPWGVNWTWIAEGDKSAAQFYIAGASGILMGLYCLTLPHTPPLARGQAISLRHILGLDSLRLFARVDYAVFIACSFLLCIPLAGYYAQARTFVQASGFNNPTLTMSYGQMSEIIFMLLMPACFARLGIKWMLAVGMLAWMARYGLFSHAADSNVKWAILVGILLHGVCYDFFFVTGFIYVDRVASPQIRAQAQGFLVLVTQGLGLGVGAQLIGLIVARYTTKPPAEPASDWVTIWLWPAGFALAVLVAFVALFHPPRRGVGNGGDSR